MTFPTSDRKKKNKYIRTVHLAGAFHSLVGRKQAKQSLNTHANNLFVPKHSGWLKWRHREPERGCVKTNSYRGTLSRPYLRNGSAKRKLVTKTH